MVITLPIGDFDLGIGVFQNDQLVIKLPISTFSSLMQLRSLNESVLNVITRYKICTRYKIMTALYLRPTLLVKFYNLGPFPVLQYSSKVQYIATISLKCGLLTDLTRYAPFLCRCTPPAASLHHPSSLLTSVLGEF